MPATRATLFALGLALAACAGASGSGPATGPATGPAVIATPPRSAGDAPVARVNGRTVWASCVAAQAGAIAAGTTAQRRAAALDQCIAFELLAQAAEARGLATAPEVAEAARGAAVNRLVETGFEQRYRTPADLAPQLDRVMKASAWRLHVPELRASTFARFVVARGAPAEADARAHALADRLAAELAGQTGLYGVHLTEAAHRVAESSGAESSGAEGSGAEGSGAEGSRAEGSRIDLATADFRPARRDELVDAYAAALYAIPEVGQASPAFRTPWGWDVVVWTGGVAARERSRDEVAAELFPELRRRQFQIWVNQIARRLGVHIAVDEAAVDGLDAEAAR